MSDSPTISRGALIAEIIVGLTYVAFIAVRASGFPPSVRAANSPLSYTIGGAIYFTLTVALFHLSYVFSIVEEPIQSPCSQASARREKTVSGSYGLQ